jgi:hypothetical protein
MRAMFIQLIRRRGLEWGQEDQEEEGSGKGKSRNELDGVEGRVGEGGEL